MKDPDHIYEHETVRPKARDSIHKVILDWFSKQPRGRVLDAPAGYGHLTRKLQQLGFEAVAGEIQPDIFKAETECMYVDLNNAIPAPDESFDYVCCVEGLEHMTNPYRAVEEFARVLKPGGVAVFSIPNYSNIEMRLRFLLKGYLTKPKTKDDFEKSQRCLYDFHNSPLTITLLDLIFSINDLQI